MNPIVSLYFFTWAIFSVFFYSFVGVTEPCVVGLKYIASFVSGSLLSEFMRFGDDSLNTD